MKEISITLEGEEAVFFWKEGQAYTEGYDLESEKAVLAITGVGNGVGVFLVAINDICKSEADFISEVNAFVGSHSLILSGKHEWYDRPKGQLLFEYYSYSPDHDKRWWEWSHARLSERHYKRLFNDPEPRFKVMMASLRELPSEYFYSLVKLSRHGIDFALAQNINCPSDVLEILAKNEAEEVRGTVAANINCPRKLLALLIWDENEEVREYARQRLSDTQGVEI